MSVPLTHSPMNVDDNGVGVFLSFFSASVCLQVVQRMQSHGVILRPGAGTRAATDFRRVCANGAALVVKVRWLRAGQSLSSRARARACV